MWNTTLIFSNKKHGLQKKLFIEKVADMGSHAIWEDKMTGLMIFIKKVNENLHILKK